MNEQNTEPTSGSSTINQDSAATSGAADIIKRGRGRPKGSASGTPAGTGGGGSVSPELAIRQQELQAQFDRLYAPETWEGLVGAPAAVALAITGDEVWKVPKDEIRTLAIQASVTARCFAVSDPKYLALTMLAIGIATTYGSRVMEYYSKKALAKAEAENKPPKG
jgi:hypothetical protein